MTTAELAGLLCRHTQWEIPTAMPLRDARALVMCMNDGASKVRQLGAEASIREPLDLYYRAPADALIGVVHGSTDCVLATAGAPFTVDTQLGTCDLETWPLIVAFAPAEALAWIEEAGGSWILIDNAWGNRLLRADTLMFRHLGPTLNSSSVHIVHDSATLGFEGITAVVEDVELADLQGNVLEKLTRMEESVMATTFARRDAPEMGIPRHYAVQAINGGEGKDPGWALRLYPAPSSAYRVRGWCVRSASRFSLEDLRTPRALPFTDTVVEQVILPLALKRALSEKLLVQPDANAIMASAREAEKILNIETQPRHRGHRMALTKRGF